MRNVLMLILLIPSSVHRLTFDPAKERSHLRIHTHCPWRSTAKAKRDESIYVISALRVQRVQWSPTIALQEKRFHSSSSALTSLESVTYATGVLTTLQITSAHYRLLVLWLHRHFIILQHLYAFRLIDVRGRRKMIRNVTKMLFF